MPQTDPRPLHLHTIESLVGDLISGRSVITAKGNSFSLRSEASRSALEWYRKKGAAAWTANVGASQIEEFVTALLQKPPVFEQKSGRSAAQTRRLILKRLRAHRFAGLHKFGTPSAPPEDYVHEFSSSVTLFEGRNGSGKTSILNAVIWALTGDLLRAQREPARAEDFQCSISSDEVGGEATLHKLTPITPMPDLRLYRPDQPWVPADTWVELTFVDERGTELPPVRRALTRTQGGKLVETRPDLSSLGVDPIALRVGTVMPGMLSLIRLGSESELGRGVAELTGLSAVVDLADHARRLRAKIDGDAVKAKIREREKAENDFKLARDDLQKILTAHQSIKPEDDLPHDSTEASAAEKIERIVAYFSRSRAAAFESARQILGTGFDPNNAELLRDLEQNTGGALERATQPQHLTSAARLARLRNVQASQLDDADARIRLVIEEGLTLRKLAEHPSSAARIRLYARIAGWLAEHADATQASNVCVVCGNNIETCRDPVTGELVLRHIQDATSKSSLLSQTLTRWAESAHGSLLRGLPEDLRNELDHELPDHPLTLLRRAIIDELFAFPAFLGVLQTVQEATAIAFDNLASGRSAINDVSSVHLPQGCESLAIALTRLERAVSFARWRQKNDGFVGSIARKVLGLRSKESPVGEAGTLVRKLIDLQATIRAASPISDAVILCGRLKQGVSARAATDARLNDYSIASAALKDIVGLGVLADQQVDELRSQLKDAAATWRSRIYLGAFPDTAHSLVDAQMGRKGELELLVQANGVSAPAQHVTNASALRATLVGFFLAFWAYLSEERGGLATLIFDDPQELLDDENKERFAAALTALVSAGAQLIVTSYDPRLCAAICRLRLSGGVEHLAVHPATRQQPVIRTTPPLPVIIQRRDKFETDRNAEEPARDFADACRVFFEASLGDMFDDPAHAAWAVLNPNPTLATFVQRLRPLVRSAPFGMFSGHNARKFVEHPGLTDNSPVLVLMNKCHHGRRSEVRSADVAECTEALGQLLDLVEAMSEECYRWRRRDALPGERVPTPSPALSPIKPVLRLLVFPDLAAFTQNSSAGESQAALTELDSLALDDTVAFYLRRPNYGFAAPAGSIAFVDATPGPSIDRSLVVARYDGHIYARRLVREQNGRFVGLTAEIPDPRARAPKTILLPEVDVSIHQVRAIIFKHTIIVKNGQDEAVQVDAETALAKIKAAFRVRDESAVPLALDGQIVFGGNLIQLEYLKSHRGALVALTLNDGSTTFKRVGGPLPGELSHLYRFESIGGLGDSRILAVGRPHDGFIEVCGARAIIGVLYDN